MYGRIESSWKKENDVVTYQFTVPANTTARLYLPAVSVKKITEGNKSLKKSKGVEYVDMKDGKVILELSSGSYSFEIGKQDKLLFTPDADELWNGDMQNK